MTNTVKQFNTMLANTYALYVKTQNYHWNVEGSDFFALHKFFEEQYQNLAESVDEIAERIRALGSKVSGDFKTYQENTVLSVANPTFSAKEMLQDLHHDHVKLIKLLNDSFAVVGGDEVSHDLIVQRLAWHEKQAWMIASHLK